MTAPPLRKCPTCRRPLDDATRSAMGLRAGVELNALCPGRAGPSDIDHVIHNDALTPQRIAFLEYKDQGALLSVGQARLRVALAGDWTERLTGRRLAIRHHVLWPSDAHKLPSIAGWVWPPDEPPVLDILPGYL
jgi:hypothetical protein